MHVQGELVPEADEQRVLLVYGLKDLTALSLRHVFGTTNAKQN